jgi:hypothetical protein
MEENRKEEAPVLSDAGAIIEQTKGEIRGRFVDNPPGPFPQTRV